MPPSHHGEPQPRALDLSRRRTPPQIQSSGESEGEELVDVLDEDDHVVAVAPRSRIRRENLRHRGVAVVVLDPSGRVLAHRRAETKDVWPGLWDSAAGGVVGAGESYEDAARRELAEELGISGVPLVHLGSGRFDNEVVRARYEVFRVTYEGPVSFPDGEVAEAAWLTVGELSELVREDRCVPDTTALLRRLAPELFAAAELPGHT